MQEINIKNDRTGKVANSSVINGNIEKFRGSTWSTQIPPSETNYQNPDC